MSGLGFALRPLTKSFGAIASGEALLSSGPLSTTLRDVIRDAVRQYRLIVLKDCGRLTAQRQVEISKWWGPIESTFSKHPRSPHTDIFRVSNDPTEGWTQVGRSGWHIDGTFVSTPFSVQTMHFVSVCPGGDTLFAPLSDVVASLDDDTRRLYSKLWYVASSPGGRSAMHPLLAKHPVTKAPTMCFHCGDNFFGGIAIGAPSENESRTLLLREEGLRILSHIAEACDRAAVRVNWAEGDLGIVDNLACAHFATGGTQADPQEVGVRILHRTSVAGVAPLEPLVPSG